MFTGIVEELARVEAVETIGGNRRFWINARMAPELKIDQSVAHNGVCLTVESFRETPNGLRYGVVAIEETLNRTNLADWRDGTPVNLERCLQANGRLDGHFVQGHVDATGEVIEVLAKNGSWVYRVAFPEKYQNLLVEKGSVCVNGVSLTVVEANPADFTIAIIPYTHEHTNFSALKTGDKVNLEFDILGKYLQKIMQKLG